MSKPPQPAATIRDIRVAPGRPLALIAGPCVIESREHCLKLGEAIREIAQRFDLPYVFKASYDKANRTTLTSPRGPGLADGLAILAAVRERLGVPVLSDIHEPAHAEPAGQALDCLQIPAFLCRQTDLLVAAAKTGKCVNIKKGQFLPPEKIASAVQKVRDSGNDNVLLTERGTTFGYERLVNDMTALAVMRRFAPVVFDATHSVQMPAAGGGVTGGAREHIPLLCRAAVAAGIDALFMEVHDDPDHALSDGTNVWPLQRLEPLLESLVRIRTAVEGH